MANSDELDFETLGFDVEHPGQFLFRPGETVTLQICHTRSRLPFLSRRLNQICGFPAVYFDPKRPALAMHEWQMSGEQAEQARKVLKPLRVSETTPADQADIEKPISPGASVFS